MAMPPQKTATPTSPADPGQLAARVADALGRAVPSAAHVATAIRQVMLVAGVITTMFSFMQQRDWRAMAAYLQTEPALGALGIVSAFAAAAWSQVSTARRKQVEADLAKVQAVLDRMAAAGVPTTVIPAGYTAPQSPPVA